MQYAEVLITGVETALETGMGWQIISENWWR